MSTTLCYNRGCGQQYNPRNNPENSCKFHPGAPYFHDAYKGWTCCGKKCTDFTEFLNTPGCETGKHSNVKPEEPESITGMVGESNNIDLPEEKPVTREPMEARVRLERPNFEKAPLKRLSPTIAKSLQNEMKNVTAVVNNDAGDSDDKIPEGESCKNGGCKETYKGEESKPSECQYHPGVPIFHEGMKFWSCCQRKTSDFQSFLDQAGCDYGKHKWKKDSEGSAQVECRHDWHQTGSHVVVAIYGKKYDPAASYVEVSPVRLKCHIVFPEQGGSFDMDIELRGIIDVDDCKANFLGTKVEVKMRKAEAGSWAKLDTPRVAPTPQNTNGEAVNDEGKDNAATSQDGLADDVDDLDLDDLDDLDVAPNKFGLSKEASGGRTNNEI